MPNGASLARVMTVEINDVLYVRKGSKYVPSTGVEGVREYVQVRKGKTVRYLPLLTADQHEAVVAEACA